PSPPLPAALRGVGGRPARQVPLRSPRRSARRQGRPPWSTPLPNCHQVIWACVIISDI
uniref:Uncharacterized protein n=1 Tax=Oryza brachyantha TaxID=4533 RepID=J3LIW5_ORYBR